MRGLNTVVKAATASIATLATIAGLPTVTVAKQRPDAVFARTLNGNAEARLHYLRSSGSELIEEGPVTGGLAGRMHAVLHVGVTFTGSFTFYTSSGEIKGHGSARPRGYGRYQSFAGTDVVSGGSGRYARAQGHGSMYGTYDRKTYAVTIQTRGMLSY